MKSPTAFRTISEVAEELNVPQHVLRFWETRFAQIKPLKRQGGRRYYRPEDVRLLRGIRYLLYGEGYRIDGVQKLLKERGAAFVSAAGEHGGVEAGASASSSPNGGGPFAAPAFATEPMADDGEPAFSTPDGVVYTAAGTPPALPPPLPAESRRRLEAALAKLDEVSRLLDEAAATSNEPSDTR